jgi:hypothetical protein
MLWNLSFTKFLIYLGTVYTYFQSRSPKHSTNSLFFDECIQVYTLAYSAWEYMKKAFITDTLNIKFSTFLFIPNPN